MATIENKEQLTQIFGRWPSIHDTEIHRVILDRDGADAPTLELAIHVWRPTSETDATGHYLLRDHTLVTLRFTRVEVDELSGFNGQNVLSGLKISDIDPTANEGRRCRVEMSSSYGLGGLFDCERIIVAGVYAFSRCCLTRA
jgi:hypothetical protein